MPNQTIHSPNTSSWALPGHVRLDDVLININGPIHAEVSNIHGRKVNIGDPGPDDHPVNSTIEINNLAGGGQALDATEEADVNRFYWATLMTQYPKYITLPPYTRVYEGPSAANPILLGDYPNGVDGFFWASWGTDVCKYIEGTDSFSVIDTMQSAAIAEGTVYKNAAGVDIGDINMWIPQGATCSTLNGSTISDRVEPAMAFAVWDNKLFRMTLDGELHWTNDGGITWTHICDLPDGSTPRRLQPFVDRNDSPLLYVVSSGRVYGLDFDGAQLISTKLFYPQHPRQGLGVEVFQGNLYVSVGLGAHRYDLSQIIPAGLDRDQGLPPEYRGYITSFSQSYNGLFALIRGMPSAAVVEETETLDIGGGDGTFSTSLGSDYSVLMMWDGVGWHYRWSGAGGSPQNVLVSQSNDNHRVWFSAGGTVNRQDLPYTYFNPGDPEDANVEFDNHGELITSWYDWNWAGQIKVLKSIEVKVNDASPICTIEIYYQIDSDQNPWVLVDTVTEPGEHKWKIGVDPEDPVMLDGSPKYIGQDHERVRLKAVMNRNDELLDPDTGLPIATKSNRPVMQWFSIIGRRVLNPQWSWRFTADLTVKDHDNPPGEVYNFLRDLTTRTKALSFQFNDEEHMVEVVSLNGDLNMNYTSSPQSQSFMQVYLLEAFENDVG
jgi:hypothetical protein